VGAPHDPELANSTEATPQISVPNWKQLIEQCAQETTRLGWTNIEVRDYLIANYKKRSRLLLDDAELLDLLHHLEQQPNPCAVSEVAEGTQIRVGDRVIWLECPPHCESFAPFEVVGIEGDYAKLDLFAKLVPLAELRKA
jgi:hypothetical protein